MASSQSSHLVFHVKRCEAEIVVPANPTPRDLKNLSDIEGTRLLFLVLWFYNNNDSLSKQGKDHVKIIRVALGQHSRIALTARPPNSTSISIPR